MKKYGELKQDLLEAGFVDAVRAIEIVTATVSVPKLRRLLSYDPETGVFRWNVDRTGPGIYPTSAKAGAVAGHITKARKGKWGGAGYRLINVCGKLYYAHRLAWFYVTGEWPKDEIDHINMIRDDNRIANLREATRSQNMKNRESSGIGLKGVTKTKGGYRAKIKIDGSDVHLGIFDTPKDARAAYVAATQKAA